ncbi:MAG: ABC transporter [Promethearchaeota archaeon]|nr:MAG: ABC transporter [Candidatus Lokiarchaeota archaeon]
MRETELMKQYEEETGNLAIIEGEITSKYRDWKSRKHKQKTKEKRKQELEQAQKTSKKIKEQFDQGKKVDKDYDHLIVVENLHKTYLLGTTAIAALRGVDLIIDKGQFISIMGPSGSGKTTLLNLIGGLDTPTRGKIFLEGKNIAMLKDSELADIRRDKIGFVFQFYNLLPQMTALENVMVPLHFSGKLSKRGKEKRAMDLLSLVGLEERSHHTPSELSGGEQQRVAIARAFANDPAICVLDEPTGDLDSKTGIQILNLLRDLNQRGATFIAVSHDAAVAEFATRTLHMRDGKLVREGKVAGLKETDIMELERKKDAQINKEKCKNKIYQYLFKNSGKKKIKIANISKSIPEPILKNLPIHFNDILKEIVEDGVIKGKVEKDVLILE